MYAGCIVRKRGSRPSFLSPLFSPLLAPHYIFRYYRETQSYPRISLGKPSTAENIIICGSRPEVRARAGKISTTRERSEIKKRRERYLFALTPVFLAKTETQHCFHQVSWNITFTKLFLRKFQKLLKRHKNVFSPVFVIKTEMTSLLRRKEISTLRDIVWLFLLLHLKSQFPWTREQQIYTYNTDIDKKHI